MKAKAKRLDNSEWVEGYCSNWKHFDGKKHIDVHTIDLGGFSSREHEIDPSTLCQQVRGTEFFEGDEMIDEKGHKLYWKFSEKDLRWYLATEYGDLRWSGGILITWDDWKPTGRNIYDLKA